MPITASGSSRSSRNAARPMAGAVLRPTGSARTCAFGSLGSWCMIARRRSSLVMIQNAFRRGKRQQARDRLLDHGLLAVERQQLLGALLAAQRPEARAAAAGKDHGIEIGVLSHGFSRIPKYADSETRKTRKRIYILVSGSGSAFPGTCARRNSTVHCGRT